MTEQVIETDVVEAMKVLKEVKGKLAGISTHVQNLRNQVSRGEHPTAKGISFLEVKYQCLLSYLINLTHLMGVKLQGQSIKDHADIVRLVELRTVLEKMRPIDQKLKYQIDKIIKTATTGISQDDPLRFKPNPDNLVSKFEDEDEDQSGEEGVKKYRPPKLAAVHYDLEETERERRDKRLEKAKKRALSSALIKELREEYDDAPEEIQESRDLHRLREDKHSKEKTEYEEKYFLRMPTTKKEMQAQRRVATMSSLGQITEFGNIKALTGEDLDDEDDERPRKKRKIKGTKGKKGKGKKGGKKKRFKP